MNEEIELPEDYMGQGSRIVYIQKEGSRELNRMILGCACFLAVAIFGVGGWGIQALISTREEMAGMRVELGILGERLERLERKP